MKKTLGLFFFYCTLFVAPVQTGCSSTAKKSGADQSRSPASPDDGANELNPIFERRMENEDQYISTIRAGILFQQGKVADNNGGKHLRGTHAKGVCVGGEMEIFDVEESLGAVAKRIKKGMFSEPGRYVTQVRFANGGGSIAPDQEPDVRAVSFSMQMPQRLSNAQGRMDFAMNDATTFPINDAEVFADLMIVRKLGKDKALRVIGLDRLKKVGAALAIGSTQEKPAKHPFQKSRYWSTVPFALGDDEAVKYSLKPCSENQAKDLTSHPNTLSREMIRHVQQDIQLACFDFQVQLLEPAKMKTDSGETKAADYWVENATIEWPEIQAPFYKVGRLTLLGDSAIDPVSCDQRSIDVSGNNNAIHRGLGSINRARTSAEAASANKRLNP